MTTRGSSRRGRILALAGTLYLGAFGFTVAHAQYSPVVITPPIEDAVDENMVSMYTGKENIMIPALQMGDVSFAPFTYNGPYLGGLFDNNYGRIAICVTVTPSGSYGGTSDCSSTGIGLQAIYGQVRATFNLQTNGQYSPAASDGSTFVDNVATNNTCTWTQRDGTQIIFVGYHVSGDSRCYSNNIAQIIHPDGRTATYYYSGTLSTSYDNLSPILSIATNTGFLLEYVYSGTPSWGLETSVVAINRGFESCNPAATSPCALSHPWPTATITRVSKPVSVPDMYLPGDSTSSPYPHQLLTIQDSSGRSYVFEVDTISRVISYQPPQATSPLYTYSLCTLLNNNTTLVNCFGMTTWTRTPVGVFDPVPVLFDLASSSSHNGQTWNYGYNFQTGNPPYGWSTWQHSVTTPLGTSMIASGNSTPGEEMNYGPIDNVTHYDGTVDHFERSVQNYFATRLTPGGILTTYSYSQTVGNLQQITKTPASGSPLSPINEYATYPTTCTSIASCYKPLTVKDANGNTVTYTYDAYGDVLTETQPAVMVNGTGSPISPQITRTYTQLSASYLNASGVMTADTNKVWLLATESFCMTSATTAGGGCTAANDQVLTTYTYGPTSGANNLLMTGKAVTANGQTLRSCYAHDLQTNKIWESTPDANPTNCPAY